MNGGTTIAESLDETLQRCRAGETEGFAEIYKQLGRTLYGTALRMLRRPADAEDAMQETFISFFRSVPDVPGLQLAAWMHRVLINHCIDRLRRDRRWQGPDLTETTTIAPPSHDGLRLDLATAVAGLPEHARVVFLLHDVEGYKHREIGEILGLSEGTTKSQLFRARAMLRRSLSERGAPREDAR